MPSVCLYFQVHQPLRIRNFSFFDIGQQKDYFNNELNEEILHKVSDNCYLPANTLLLSLVKKYKGKFYCCFSLSGILIEQLAKHRPDVIASFKALADTGCIEFLGETYYHSLAAFYNKEEFDRQIKLHKKAVKKYFGKEPVVFRNTELLYQDAVSETAFRNGYQGVWIEGSENNLGKANPNRIYTNATEQLVLIPRNFVLSDEIAFRFKQKATPLTAQLFTKKILQLTSSQNTINLGLDYETFGEHFHKEEGILSFLSQWINNCIQSKKITFLTPSATIDQHYTVKKLNVPHITSWADSEKDISAWVQNDMQKECIEKLYALRDIILKLKNRSLLETWSALQCSDHFYYMSTKQHSDGEVHNYFSPFDSPHGAYIAYINVLADLELKIDKMRIYHSEQ
ncbi:MAG: alpha-amylase [Chitinophagaceae bacterium]|nr:alpha-amylase [Chitinophagaceae bacterium]